MNVQCRLVELVLSHRLATGRAVCTQSWLGHHMAGCERCRAALETLKHVAEALPQTLAAPAASSDLTDRVMERVLDSAALSPAAKWPRHKGLFGVGLALAAGVLLAIAVRLGPWDHPSREVATAMRIPSVKNEPTVVAENKTKPIEPAEPSMRATGRNARGKEGAKASTVHQKDTDVLVRLLIRGRRKVVKQPAPEPRVVASVSQGSRIPAPSANSVAADPTLATLVTLGAYYEANSDFRRAAVAYYWASQTRSDAGLVYAAGRAAEAVGDIPSAVEQYRKLLEPQDAQDNRSGTPSNTSWQSDERKNRA